VRRLGGTLPHRPGPGAKATTHMADAKRPSERDLAETERWLVESPEVEAKALFEYLLATFPDRIEGRALRTFQRRVSEWLRRQRPPKEVFFAQVHEMGECVQTDLDQRGTSSG